MSYFEFYNHNLPLIFKFLNHFMLVITFITISINHSLKIINSILCNILKINFFFWFLYKMKYIHKINI